MSNRVCRGRPAISSDLMSWGLLGDSICYENRNEFLWRRSKRWWLNFLPIVVIEPIGVTALAFELPWEDSSRGPLTRSPGQGRSRRSRARELARATLAAAGAAVAEQRQECR